MHDVLVLNATYQPLSIVSSRRAIVLVLSERAELISAEADVLVRSEHLSIEMPSVIRLCRYVRLPTNRRAHLSRRAVLRRDQHSCAYCGSRANTVDHVVPRSRGGTHSWTNVVAACQSCNSRKGARLVDEIGWQLRTRPTEPRADWTVSTGHRRPDWEPWIAA